MKTLNTTAQTEAANKEEVMRAKATTFFNKNLALIEMKEGRRNALRAKFENFYFGLSGTKAGGPAAYNFQLQRAIQTNVVEPAKARGMYNVVEQAQEELVTDKWAIVNKATGEIEGYASSRRKAQATKNVNQTVKKTEQVA